MGAMIHFGADGWRARLDGDFTDENVTRIADAAGALWAREAVGALVYVGYDTRPGAREFARLAGMVLAAHGLVVKVSSCFVPTPALAWTVAQDARAVGGLMITGARRPDDYQGIKLRMSDGGLGTDEFYEELEREIDSEPTTLRGPIEETDFFTRYLDHLYTLVDVDSIARAGIRLTYDPLFGSASGNFAGLMRAMGVDVREIHGEPGRCGKGVHPEPVEPWVDECEQAVVASGCDAGLVNDGDGSRVGAVDAKGRFLGPQKLMAIALNHLCVDRGQSGRVVLSVSSSMLVRRIASARGCKLTIKPIGFKHIYSEMLKGDVLMGGGDADGIGIARHMPERDGLLVNLLLIEAMAQTGKGLGELADELEEEFGSYDFGHRDIRVDPEVIEMLRTVLPGLNPPVVAGRIPTGVSHMDGLRLEFDDSSWLLIRPSTAEPVIRVYAEAPEIEQRDLLLDAGVSIARGEFS